MIFSRQTTSLSFVALGLLAASLGLAQTQTLYLPQVADGGSWQTTLVITNTSSSAASISSMNFYMEVAGGTGGTQSWSLNFIEPTTLPMNVPAGSTILLHTFGTASVTTTGWGAINAGPGINAYAIFTQRIAGRQDQDGTGLALPAASRFLVPFDQTNGSVVGLAIANTGSSAATVTVAVRTTNGAPTQAALTVPPLGHFNFALPTPPSALSAIGQAVSGQSGLMEVYTSSPSLAVLTLRFNVTSSFTAAPVYPEAGAPVIGTAAGSTAAPFSSLFINGTWTQTSTASPVVINVTANSDGTYKAAVVSSQQPYLLVSFPSGTLSGNALTFASPASNGLFGTTLSITGGSLTLTVSNFNQVGSPVSGTMTVNSTTGSVTGTSTYQP
jgi:hypothetical protein